MADAPQVAAFFDMDKTVVLGHTGRMYFRHLREKGEIGWTQMLQASSVLFRYKFSIINMPRVMAFAAKEMEGMPVTQFVDTCETVFEERILPQLSAAAIEAIEGHRRQGHLLVMLSASTPGMVEPVCRHLGMDDFICTQLTVENGQFTGDFVRPMCFGAGKTFWAERYAEEKSIDLEKSYFYTDSYTDLPMLERVGFKRVVNPDPRLRLHAMRRRWPVLRFHR
jgi:putative phosphoserine phosphatase/1-acylglycerol-3-phosphate O-acyltransferase